MLRGNTVDKSRKINSEGTDFECLLKEKLFQKEAVDSKLMPQIENMLHNYYRFKIFWKQESIKKFLEGHLGLKMSQLKDLQSTSQIKGEFRILFLYNI